MSDSSVSSTQVATQQPSASTGIQVQVIPAQTQVAAMSNNSNPSSLLATSGDISTQVTQLTSVRLPADPQQRLLLAQLQQQLSKTNSSLPANASFVLQPAFQGITVVTSAPSSTTSSNDASKG